MPSVGDNQVHELRRELLSRAAEALGPAAAEVVEHACDLAERAHHGQVRDEGTPYVTHPFRVALMLARDLEAIAGDPELMRTVEPCDILVIALLHDVVEDAPAVASTPEWQALAEPIRSGVQLLTRESALTKQQYYDRLSRAPEHIRLVKLADRIDNLSGIARSPVPGKRERKVAETLSLVLPLAEAPASPVLEAYAGRLRSLTEGLTP